MLDVTFPADTNYLSFRALSTELSSSLEEVFVLGVAISASIKAYIGDTVD